MYVRTKTFANKDGSTRTYLYLVETVRSSGKVRQVFKETVDLLSGEGAGPFRLRSHKLGPGAGVSASVGDAGAFGYHEQSLCSKRELYRHWLKMVYRPAFDELQPQHFYRTLDLLAENKDRIETALFEKARDLFTLDLDLVLWDTTSTYFEGNGPDEIGAFGLSKDHRPDRVQVMVGVLMTRDGYPVAHEVFSGFF